MPLLLGVVGSEGKHNEAYFASAWRTGGIWYGDKRNSNVVMDSQNNFIFTSLWNASSSCKYNIYKVNLYGQTLWKKRFVIDNYSGTNSLVGPNYVACDKDDNYYAFYNYRKTNVSPAILTTVLAKHDKDGNVVWAKSFILSSSTNQISSSLATDSVGNIVATLTNTFNSTTSLHIFKLNSSGDVLWKKAYSNVFVDASTLLRINADDEYILSSPSSNNSYMKLNNNGDILSVKYTSGTGGRYCGSDNLNNSYYIYNNVTYGLTLAKFNESNQLSWSTTLKNSNNNTLFYSYSVENDSNNNAYVVLFTYVPSTLITIVVVFKIDSSGQIVWKKQIKKTSSSAGGIEIYNLVKNTINVSKSSLIVPLIFEHPQYSKYPMWVSMPLDGNCNGNYVIDLSGVSVEFTILDDTYFITNTPPSVTLSNGTSPTVSTSSIAVNSYNMTVSDDTEIALNTVKINS